MKERRPRIERAEAKPKWIAGRGRGGRPTQAAPGEQTGRAEKSGGSAHREETNQGASDGKRGTEDSKASVGETPQRAKKTEGERRRGQKGESGELEKRKNDGNVQRGARGAKADQRWKIERPRVERGENVGGSERRRERTNGANQRRGESPPRSQGRRDGRSGGALTKGRREGCAASGEWYDSGLARGYT